MTIECIETDSRVFGRNVLAIHDLDPEADFPMFERAYIEEYGPAYVYCKVPVDRITHTHVLERNGFNLVECQIRSSIKLRKTYPVSTFNYDFRQVTRESELKDVLDIAGTTFVNDRFSLDRALDPAISSARYQEYVRKSFRAPDEAVYRLVDRSSGRVVAFKTHRYVGSDEVLFLLGGVHPEFKKLGIGIINEYFEFNELIGKGIKRAQTHISAGNYAVFNLEIGKLGFRVLATFAVLRKLYP